MAEIVSLAVDMGGKRNPAIEKGMTERFLASPMPSGEDSKFGACLQQSRRRLCKRGGGEQRLFRHGVPRAVRC